MFRTKNTIALLSLFCLLISLSSVAQDSVLITQFDRTFSYGMELLYNDANDDLILLYLFEKYEEGTTDLVETSLRSVHLQRDGSGTYMPVKERTLFETSRYIQQLDWTYDPVSKQYLIELLDEEESGAVHSVRLALLNLSGALVGKVKELTADSMEFNHPQVCAVPANTVGAPAEARFFYLSWGWNKATQRTGLVSVFLNKDGNPIGDLEFSYKNKKKQDAILRFEPMQLLPSGDKKGFVIACNNREGTTVNLFPTFVRLSGSAEYVNHVVLGDEAVKFNAISVHQVSKKKFAVAWVDIATNRFWSASVTADAKKAKAAKLVSEKPACTSINETPYLKFSKPEKAKKARVFCIGDYNDPTVYSLFMKKNGKASKPKLLNLWSDITHKAHDNIKRWVAVAPIMGTKDSFCAVILRNLDQTDLLEVHGYVVKGK